MNPPSDQWALLFDRHSTQTTLDQAVDTVVLSAMRDLLRRVNADETLTFEQRSAILLRAHPLIRQRTREFIETGWSRLQAKH